MTAVRSAVRLRFTCGLLPCEPAGDVAVVSPYVVGDTPHRRADSRTAPQPQVAVRDVGAGEGVACPPITSSKKTEPDPAAGAWPAIAACLAAPADDSRRLLCLLEPWPDAARQVHRIRAADEAPRRRRRKSAHDCNAPGRTDSTEIGSVNALANKGSSGDGARYPLSAPRCDSESNDSYPTGAAAMLGAPARQDHSHTQPSDLRQRPAPHTASTKET